MRSTRAFLIPSLIVTSVGVTYAVPDGPVTLARLDVRAAAECTSPTDLAARITARSPRIRFVDDKNAVIVKAQVSSLRSGKILGELAIAAQGTVPTSRRLIADSCAQAAEGIALIVAVTLDPTSVGNNARAEAKDGTSSASLAESATTSPAKPPSNSAEKSERARSDASTNPSPQKPAAKTETEVQAASRVSSLAQSPAQRRQGSGRIRVGAYLAGQSLFGPAPKWMPGIAAHFSAELDGSYLWSPALVLGIAHAWRSELVQWGGTASFSLDAASLDGCPVALRWGNAQARACASILLGILTAEGTATLNPPEPVSRPFAAVGPTGLLTWEFGANMALFARIGVGMNLVRDAFEFSPRVFHEVDAATVSGSLGIGFRDD